MTDYIMDKIQAIFDTVATAGSGTLVLTPSEFNENIYNGIVLIMKNGVMPVAYVILGLLFMLELYNITIRTDPSSGTMGFEIPMRTLFKLTLCKTAIDSTELILNAIYSISSQIITNIAGTITGGNSLTTADTEAIRTIVDGLDLSVKLMTAVEVTIIYLIIQLVMVIISVMVVGRMIELYIMMAIAPIPMATFPNAEMSGVGKNFLKGFAAVCVQGVLIYIVIAIFPLLFGNDAMGDISSADEFMKSLFTALGYSFVLLISIFATSRWAKSICNAM